MTLKAFREKARITQKELEVLSGVKQVTISKIERGAVEAPNLKNARKLVAGLIKAGIVCASIDQVFPESNEDVATN